MLLPISLIVIILLVAAIGGLRVAKRKVMHQEPSGPGSDLRPNDRPPSAAGRAP